MRRKKQRGKIMQNIMLKISAKMAQKKEDPPFKNDMTTKHLNKAKL